MNKPRAIFFGTPEFAVPCLGALCDLAEVVLVVTQPDRPAGRGMKLTPPAVRTFALERGLHVVQPTKVRTPEFAASLRELSADVALVVAYGRILPAAVLQAPRLGCVNVHASLLPGLRGAAPIQWAIVRGEPRSGVCLMQMDEGMDTGPVLSCAALDIGPEETAGELGVRLSQLGSELVAQDLPRFLCGELPPQPQDHTRATLAPMLTKQHGRVDFRRSAREVHDLVRGFSPRPGAYALLDDQRVKLHRVRVLVATGAHAQPGTVVRADRHAIEVACGAGLIAIEELQPEGKRRMSAADFCAGSRLQAGARFATPAE